MTSGQDQTPSRRMLMERSDELYRHPFRSLRSYGSRDGQVTTFGLDRARIGGDETKLLNHYGFSTDELERSPSAGQRTKNPLSIMRPSDSHENLRRRRAEQRGPSSYRSQDQLREVAQNDNTPRSKPRDTPKFSFRKVFGLNATEQSLPGKSRDIVSASDAESADNSAAHITASHDTTGWPLPASKRRTSIENRDRPASTIPPDSRSRRDSSRPRIERSQSSLAAEPPTVPTRRRRSTVKRVQSDEKPARPRSTTMIELTQAFTTRPITPPTPSLSKTRAPKHPIPARRSSSRHNRDSRSRDLGNVDIPPLPTRPVEFIDKPSSEPGSNTSDEKKTIRPRTNQTSPSLPTEPRPQPIYVSSAEYSSFVFSESWTPSTAPRQAMEAASFFARIAELENRMASAERSLAKLKRKDQEQQQQQQRRQEEQQQQPTDEKNYNQHHQQQQSQVRRSMHSVYNRKSAYMESEDVAKAPTPPHPYLTPPSSQLSDVGGREATETWLDPSSSTSSFADSVSEPSRRPSSRTSLSPNTLERTLSSSPTDHTPRPQSGLKQNQAMAYATYTDTNDARSYILSKISAERASRRLAVNAELDSMRVDLAKLRTDASNSPGPFSKAAPLISKSTGSSVLRSERLSREADYKINQPWDRRDNVHDATSEDQESTSEEDEEEEEEPEQTTLSRRRRSRPQSQSAPREFAKANLRASLQSRQSGGYQTPADSADDNERAYNLSRATTRTELSRPVTRIRV